MFCPQCGHQQTDETKRFCSHCGLSLDFALDLLPHGGEQIERKKEEVMGISWMWATVLMLFNFFLVYGAITLPHLTNRVFLWLWLFFLVSTLITGLLGLRNLIRSGFFKKLQERDERLRLINSRQKYQSLLEQKENADLYVQTTQHLIEPITITEATTRELSKVPKSQH